MRPLVVRGLSLDTRLACRSDSQERIVRDLVRSFVRQIAPPFEATQLPLRLAG